MPTTTYASKTFVKDAYYTIKVSNTGGVSATVTFTIGTKTLMSLQSMAAGQVVYLHFRGEGNTVNAVLTYTASTVTSTCSRTRKNYYKPWDGTGLTIAYNNILNRWMLTYMFEPEQYCTSSSDLVSFSAGAPYIHDAKANRCEFYGITYPVAFAVPVKAEADPQAIIVAKGFESEGSATLDWVHIRTEKPFVQSTEILAADFKDAEGKKFAKIHRDRKTPGSGTSDDNWNKGHQMRGEAIMVAGEFTASTTAYLNSINIFYNYSKGF
jgi:hypothetical protein